MSATKYNFEINQGETFDLTMTLLTTDRRPVDLTGYEVRGMIRGEYADVAPLMEFDCSIVDATEGKIRVFLTADEAAALSFTKAVYDIEIESTGGVVTRVVQGTVKLSREATK